MHHDVAYVNALSTSKTRAERH